MNFALALTLAAAPLMAATTELPTTENAKSRPEQDCKRTISLAKEDKKPTLFREGPAAESQALLLLAVDQRIDECRVLVTFDGTIREPVEPGVPTAALQPVRPD